MLPRFTAASGLMIVAHHGLGLAMSSVFLGTFHSKSGRHFLPSDKPTEGEVHFGGKDITRFHSSELRSYRRSVQAVFQDPFSSLSPRLKVREIITEPLEVTTRLGKMELERQAPFVWSRWTQAS